MWLRWLALLIAIAFGCSFLAPGSGLHASALRAFDSSVSMLSRGDIESTLSDGGDEEDEDNAGRRPVRSVASRQPVAPLKTSAIRRRVTPLMQKCVAVRYDSRCALCNTRHMGDRLSHSTQPDEKRCRSGAPELNRQSTASAPCLPPDEVVAGGCEQIGRFVARPRCSTVGEKRRR